MTFIFVDMLQENTVFLIHCKKLQIFFNFPLDLFDIRNKKINSPSFHPAAHGGKRFVYNKLIQLTISSDEMYFHWNNKSVFVCRCGFCVRMIQLEKLETICTIFLLMGILVVVNLFGKFFVNGKWSWKKPSFLQLQNTHLEIW